MRIIRSTPLFAFVGSTLASLCFLSPGPAVAGDVSACMTAARANLAANSYHTTMVESFSKTPKTTTVDIAKPNRMHEQSPDNEMIAIGSKVWMKMNGGPWKLMPGMGDVGSLVSTDATKEFKMHGNATCVDAGMGIWKGRPAHVFKGTSTDKDGTITSTMYQLSDGFVHHVDVSSKKLGVSSFDFSNFNSTTVSPP